MKKRITWKPELRKLSDLKPFAKNPRIITEQGLKELGDSFDEVGQCQPLAVNTDNTILSGHARAQRLISEDANGEVLVMVPDRTLTPKQEEAVIIRLNKNVVGKWDFDILANQFEMSDLANWGFTEADLSVMSKLDEPDFELDTSEAESEPVNDSEHYECARCGHLNKK